MCLKDTSGRFGITVMQGGGGSVSPWPADTSDALLPGQAIAAVLISGDMSANGVGTVTYNDGKRVLAFGHAMFRLGPVDMPMAKSERIVTVLASEFAPDQDGELSRVSSVRCAKTATPASWACWARPRRWFRSPSLSGGSGTMIKF